MRILHVNKFLYRRGGAEGYMLDLAELQVRAGHEVAFYGMDHPENPPRPYQLLDHGRVCEACLGGHFHHAVLRRCKDGSLGASAVVAVESTVHRLTRAYGTVGWFISPSRFLAGKMAQGGVSPDRLRVLDHFVDTASTVPKTVAGGQVLFAGRLAPEKGVDVLIGAMAGLGSWAELDVAGDGPERARLEALAVEHAPGRVRFHGRLPKGRLLDMVRSAAVVVVPSRWHENQPM